jgi:hypothetical protein
MPKYVLHDGELVSAPWKTALIHMERELPNNVNEGKRTMERQRFFWNCGPSGCCCCNNCNLAAFPSPFAPHIRVGRIDHAIDFSDGAGAERWLDRHDIRAWRSVPGEDWHVEVNASDLKRFHKENLGDRYDNLPKHIERIARDLISARHTVRTRIQDRDKIDSQEEPRKWQIRDRLVDEAVSAREKKRERVERVLQRARKPQTKRILRQLLDVNQ